MWKGSPRAGNTAGVTLLSSAEFTPALTTGQTSELSPVVTNLSGSAFQDLFMDAFLEVTFAAAPTANSTCDLYIVRQVIDGVFEDGAGTNDAGGVILPGNGYVGSFKLRAVTTAQKVAIGFIEVPPRDHKFLLVNLSGTTMPTTATVKAYYYRYQSL
jgi:hypothetical protein